LPRNGAAKYIDLKSSKKQGPLGIRPFLVIFPFFNGNKLIIFFFWNKEKLPDQESVIAQIYKKDDKTVYSNYHGTELYLMFTQS
jgi:hypothetical protein